MKRFRYTFHNIIGHPLMEILNLCGMEHFGTMVHDITLPEEQDEN
jgi:hypothetical protein